MTQQPQQTFEPSIEEQLRYLLQALDMVHSTPWDGFTPRIITNITGKAKDDAIDEILQELRRYYQTMQNTIPSGEKK
ncbi:hypothetical protein [Pseudomonas syringae]|uniref:hypothetical protein n=1 Tax=Pseudomonas syringae TaxID=317 RepID=UPI0011D0F09B|nr:hypothetical protein [Pseudomonas syringae]